MFVDYVSGGSQQDCPVYHETCNFEENWEEGNGRSKKDVVFFKFEFNFIFYLWFWLELHELSLSCTACSKSSNKTNTTFLLEERTDERTSERSEDVREIVSDESTPKIWENGISCAIDSSKTTAWIGLKI